MATKKKNKIVRVLSLDGGGQRGMIPAAILVELERRAGRPIASMFDLIAGTSIGGILACLLASGVPAAEAIKFFTVDGKVIFKKHWWRALGLILPRYPARQLERVLQTRLAHQKLNGCKTKLLVTSLELVSQKPYFFKNYLDGQNDFLWRVARATSAAQTYFPAFSCPDAWSDKVFWDGGNVANNPSLCAYADAVKLWGDDFNVKILSLGCGSSSASINPEKMINGGAIRAAAATVQMLFEAGSEDVDYQMEQMIGKDYVRIQPVLKHPFPIDGVSDEDLENLRLAGNETIAKFSNQLDEWARMR
jgi:predicted acylesterase/phospholipase RssA